MHFVIETKVFGSDHFFVKNNRVASCGYVPQILVVLFLCLFFCEAIIRNVDNCL